MRRAHAVWFLVVAGLGGCGSSEIGSAGDKGDLFPLRVGDRWVYRTHEGEETREVVGMRTVDGASCFVCRSDDSELVYSVSAEGVRLHEMDGAKLVPPVLMVKNPLRPGDAWQWKGRRGNREIQCEFRCESEEEVYVPIGTVRSRKVVQVVRSGDSTTEDAFWFTPGIGLIQQAEDGDVTSRLILFKPAR